MLGAVVGAEEDCDGIGMGTRIPSFLEVCGGDDFERVDADDVARALSMKVKKARDLCDVDKSEDGRVDHAGFVRIASSQRRCCFSRGEPHT